MALPPISPISSILTAPPAQVAGIDAVGSANPASAKPASGGPSFGAALEQAYALESDASTKAIQLATGELTDVQQFTAAAAKASLAVELSAAVRNRAVDAFSEIMRMQV